jgi:hypothetical protein
MKSLNEENMTQKKLEKGSVWEKADTNGDGVVSDREMAMRERMVLLENRDKKEDQQRYLVGIIAEIWVLSNMGVIGSFIGFNQLAKRNGEEKRPH